ncbi:MAG: VIT domain-containing protein [Planctomycetota bacterium]
MSPAARPLLALGLLLAAAPVRAEGELIPSARELAPLGLETHDVRVTICDGVARTEVTQTFFNQHEREIEATYRFPLPRDAALAGCSIWIAGREVQGEVVRRERAERIRQRQQARGREVATAEQEGFRGFQVRVSPIRPRARQQVRLVYYQPLEVDQGIGRYVYPLAPGNTDRARALFEERPVQARVRVGVELRSALPLLDVATPGWPEAKVLSVSGPDARAGDRRRVLLEACQARLEHDFVLYWRLAPQREPALRVVAQRAPGAAAGTFLLTLDPGLHDAAQGSAQDWVFLLDVSGSMRGAKLSAASEACVGLLESLAPGDTFRLLSFADRVEEFGGIHSRRAQRSRASGGADETEHAPERQPVTPESVARAAEWVRALAAGGNTDLYRALRRALDRARGERPAAVVLVTDGVANVGPRSARELDALIARFDVRVFALQLGNEANGPLLDLLARRTGGFRMDVSTADLVEGRVLQARGKLAHPVLRGVEVTVEGASDLTPDPLPAVYAGQPLQVFGRYTGHGPRRVRVRGLRAGAPFELEATIELPDATEDYPELERLWALRRIQDLEREVELAGGRAPEREARLVELALRYGLVTPWTALVVVPDEDRAGYALGDDNARRLAQERAAMRARQQPQAQSPVQGPPATPSRATTPSGAFGSAAVQAPMAHAPGGLGPARPPAPPPAPSRPRPRESAVKLVNQGPEPAVLQEPREDPYDGPGARGWGGGGGWSWGHGGGGGAFGPLGALLSLALAARRRRRAA